MFSRSSLPKTLAAFTLGILLTFSSSAAVALPAPALPADGIDDGVARPAYDSPLGNSGSGQAGGAPADAPAPIPGDAQAPAPSGTEVPAPGDTPLEEPIEEPSDGLTEPTAPEPSQAPTPDPTGTTPSKEPSEEPSEDPGDAPSDTPETSASTLAIGADYLATRALNLREANDIASPLRLTVPRGGLIQLLESAGSRAKVTYLSFTGWVEANFLTAATSGVNLPETRALRTTSALNLRSDATSGSGKITTMPPGSIVQVLGWRGTWQFVDFGGTQGWAAGSYLTPAGNFATLRLASSNINLRSSNSTSASVAMVIPKGASVEVLSQTGSWINARYRGTTGWISAPLLSLPSTTHTSGQTPALKVTTALNLRSVPGSAGAITTVLPKNAIVQVLGWRSGWRLVAYRGYTGWASANFLTATGPFTTLHLATANVNLRTGAGVSNAAILTVPTGATLGVIRTDGEWTFAAYEGHQGWLITTALGAQTFALALPPPAYEYAQRGLILRAEPQASATSLRSVPSGAKVRILGWKNGWRLANYLGSTGWLTRSDLSAEYPYRYTVNYRVITDGAITTSLATFISQVNATLNDPRGWRGKGIRFQQVTSGGSMVVVLANAARVRDYAPWVCDNYYSCRVGNYVIINQDRWKYGTPAWNNAGGSLRDYRHMVVNHEVGHWLDNRHSNCPGRGQPAPVMQQQSVSLQGCTFNPWPLPTEIAPRFR